ncbi:hypothetical protein F4825DRAFT_451677 [Nemania diffusa]|nr:hypothetical protein F4825DRAFT_451677 [Nemania diffusa]
MSFSWQQNHALEQEVEQRRQKQKKRRLEDWLESVATNTDDSNATMDNGSNNLQPSKRARHAVPSDSQSYIAMTPPFTTSGSHKRGSEAMASDSDPNAPPAQSNYFDASSRSRRRTHQDARKVYTPKSPEELEFLETPVFVKILPANVDITYNILPNDVHTLYKRLYDTSAYKAIIPHDVQSDVTRIIPNATPDLFIGHEAEDTEEADEAQAQEPNMQAKAELKSLQNLIQVSMETAKYGRHETTWNHFIHGPLLQMIYSSKVLLEDDMFDLPYRKRLRCTFHYQSPVRSQSLTQSQHQRR